MHNWFECKVSYEKILENGMQKKVTEPYLVDALSFTEAEARITEEIRPYITGEFTIANIKRAHLSFSSSTAIASFSVEACDNICAAVFFSDPLFSSRVIKTTFMR